MAIDVLHDGKWRPADRVPCDFAAYTDGRFTPLLNADKGRTWRDAERIAEGDEIFVSAPGIDATERLTVQQVDYNAGVIIAGRSDEGFVLQVKLSTDEIKWARVPASRG